MATWSWDTETFRKNPDTGEWEPILDASGKYVIMLCIKKDTGGHKTFTGTPEEIRKAAQEYIVQGAIKEFNRGKKLTIVGHNARYEYFNIMDLNDKNLRIFRESPFIAGYYMKIEKEFDTQEKFDSWCKWAKMNRQYYKIEAQSCGITRISYNKEIIKFLDTISLFRMSLKKMGNLIGISKTEMPIDIGKKLTKVKLKTMEKYCLNDCVVCLGGYHYLNDKLKAEGLHIKNLCTINQVAISYLINELRKGQNDHILTRNSYGKLTENTWKTYFAPDVHQAYRGGYVRVWKTGEIDNVTHVDFNSLYPFSAMHMKFPDLRTERKIKEPLKQFKIDRLFDKIGLSKCMIHNVSDELGLLLVRTEGKAYVLGKNKYAVGVWTHTELKEALKQGYVIKDIEWSIIYDEGTNPFTQIFGNIYKKRMKSESEFDNYFYKMIMNAGIGKFGQTRQGQEILVDDVSKVYEYINKGYKMLGDIENTANVVYINRDTNKGQIKKYYAPIISALITANARVIMYRNFKKVPLKDLVYTDTDSIITQGDYRHLFDMGNDIGQFKVEKDVVTGEELIGTKAIIWGTKCKAIGNNIGVSGVFKADLTLEDFQKGTVYAKKMMGIKNKQEKDIGEFLIEERDLKKQLEDFEKSEEIINSQKLYLDKGIEDISYFGNELTKLLSEGIIGSEA